MHPDEILAATDHRPWPLPDHPWVMKQVWHKLLFAHWTVEPAELRPLIPVPLTLDTYQGEAWMTIAPFWVTGARLHHLPPVPIFSRFLQTNVRTYVVVDDKPGTLFFSLDVSNPLIAALTRTVYRLPFISAHMTRKVKKDSVRYVVRRNQSTFRVDYRSTSPSTIIAQPGTLDHWLVERYCLYTTNPAGRMLRGEIHHHPWQLQSAAAEIQQHQFAPMDLEGTPLRLHYIERQDALAWALTEC